MFLSRSSRRAAFLKLTCVVSSLVVLGAAALSVRHGSDLAVLATLLATAVAAMSGVGAYWSRVDGRAASREPPPMRS